MAEQIYPIRVVVSSDRRGLTDLRRDIDSTAQSVQQLGERTDSSSRRSVSALSSLRGAYSALSAQWVSVTGALRQQVSRVTHTAQAYSGLAAQLLVVKTATAALSAAAVGLVPHLAAMGTAAGLAFGTGLSTVNVAAASKELENLARSTDISKQALQEWRIAGRFEGIAADLNAFGDMSKVLGDVGEAVGKLGTKDGAAFAASLKSIGLSARDLQGLNAHEAILKMGEAFDKSGLTSKQKKNLLASISDDAGKLLPLLEGNRQKLDAIKQYANAVGAIQTDSQLAAIKQTNTELSYFKLGLEGVQTQLSAVGANVVNTLGPNIRQLFIDARGPIEQWSQAVSTAVTKLKTDLESTGSWIEAFKLSFQSIYPTMYQFLASAGTFGKSYGEAFITPMLDALKAGYANISSALGEAGGAANLGKAIGEGMRPVIDIANGVSNAIVLVIKNWETLKTAASFTPVGFAVANWSAVVSVFESVGNGIKRVGEAFGLLNPATTGSVTGVQTFTAALGLLLVSGASTRIALGLVGAAFSTISFALTPVTAAISAAPAIWGAFATALGVARTAILAMTAAALANPIIAIATGIAAAAGLIYANWDKIGPWWSSLWGGIKSTASSAWDSVKNSTQSALSVIERQFPATYSLINTHTKAWAQVMRGDFAGAWQTIQAGAVDFAQKFTAHLQSMAGKMSEIGKSITSSLSEAIKSGAAAVVSAGSKLVDDLIDAIKKGIASVKEIGGNIAEGLKNGILEKTSSVVGAVKGMASNAISVAKETLGIRSPSRVMMEQGGYFVEGFAIGITDNTGRAKDAAKGIASGVVDTFNSLPSEMQNIGQSIISSLTDALGSGDWKGALSSIVDNFAKPAANMIQQSLGSALQNMMSGKGFNFSGSSLANMFATIKGGGFSGAMGAGGLGATFGQMIGQTGIGTGIGAAIGNAIMPGLGGVIGGGLGALAESLFGGKQDIKGTFGSYANTVQNTKFVSNDHRDERVFYQTKRSSEAFHRTSAFGQFGVLQNGSVSIGRDDPKQIEAIQKALDGLQQLDNMIASFLPDTVIQNVKTKLDGLQTNALDTQGLVRERLHAIFSGLPSELQAAINSNNVMAESAEAITARFAAVAAVAASGVIPSLEALGWGMGATETQALAAAINLSDAAGGLDQLNNALSSYTQAAYTEAERLQMQKDMAQDQIDAFNELHGTQLQNILDLRAYIDTLKTNSGANAEAIAGAMALTQALVTVGGTADEIAKAAQLAAQQAALAQTAQTSAVQNTTAAVQASAQAQIQAAQAAETAARQAAENVQSLYASIGDLAQRLYGSMGLDSGGSAATGGGSSGVSESLQKQYDAEKARLDELNRIAQDNYQTQLDYYRNLIAAAESLRNIAKGFADEVRTPEELLRAAQQEYNRTLTAAKAGDVDAASKLRDVANRFKDALNIGYNYSSRASFGIQQVENQLADVAKSLDVKAGTEPQKPAEITSVLLASLEAQIKAAQAAQSAATATQQTAQSAAERTALALELAGKIGGLGLALDVSVFDLMEQNGIDLRKLSADVGINISQLDLSQLRKIDALADALHLDSVTLGSKLGANIDLMGDLIADSLSSLPNVPTDIKTGLAPYFDAIKATTDPTTLKLAIGILQGKVETLPTGIKDQLNAQLSGIVGNTTGITANLTTLIASNKTELQTLASSLGVDLKALQSLTTKLDTTTAAKFADLASALNTDLVTLGNALGANFGTLGNLIADKLKSLPNLPSDIRSYLNPSLDAIRLASDNTSLIAAMNAVKLAVNGVPDGVRSQLNERLTAIVASNNSAATVSAVNDLQYYINSLPSGIRSQLNTHLSGILSNTGGTINSTEAVKSQVQLVQNYINGLPTNIKAQLNTQLEGITGNTGNTKTSTDDVKREVAAVKTNVDTFAANGSAWLFLRNISDYSYGALVETSHVSDHVRDTKGITNAINDHAWIIRRHINAQNSNWSQSGKSNIPAFAVGSDRITHDQVAQVHQGEVIFTAAQSASLREQTLSILSWLPSVSRMIAANDEPSPPSIIYQDIKPMTASVSHDAEDMRAFVQELKAYRQEFSEYRQEQRNAQFVIARATKQVADTMDDWERKGLPPTEAAA